MAFTSRNGTGNVWNPTINEDLTPKMKGEEGDFIHGYYVELKNNIGKHGSSVAVLQKEDGTRVDIWANSVLVDKLGQYRLGEFLEIRFEERVLKKGSENKKPALLGKDDYYIKWSVGVDEEVEPLKDLKQPAAKENASNKVTETGAGQKKEEAGEKKKETVKAPGSKFGNKDDLPF